MGTSASKLTKKNFTLENLKGFYDPERARCVEGLSLRLEGWNCFSSKSMINSRKADVWDNRDNEANSFVPPARKTFDEGILRGSITVHLGNVYKLQWGEEITF